MNTRVILLLIAIAAIGGGAVLVSSGQRLPAEARYRANDTATDIPVTNDPGEEDALVDLAKAVSAPKLQGENWTNSAPLELDQMKGQIVLIEFWTFDCYNCRNTLPSIKSFNDKYGTRGLTVIGVHTPELDQERVWPNVAQAVKELGITYPVVSDNGYQMWKAYRVEAWPTIFILDRQGRIRFRHTGEGEYGLEERVIQKLLAERE
jgi:alkyl hydroperoxide reductase subunit AhpC